MGSFKERLFSYFRKSRQETPDEPSYGDYWDIILKKREPKEPWEIELKQQSESEKQTFCMRNRTALQAGRSILSSKDKWLRHEMSSSQDDESPKKGNSSEKQVYKMLTPLNPMSWY